MDRLWFLIVTALVEVGAGLLLLFWPTVPLLLLLGIGEPAPETLLIGRIAGVALGAISVACWLARKDRGSPGQRGLLLGVLIYDVGAAVLLTYAGLALGMVGLALWPGVVLHTLLAVWGISCLRTV